MARLGPSEDKQTLQFAGSQGSVGLRAELPGCSASALVLPEPTLGQRNQDKEMLQDRD